MLVFKQILENGVRERAFPGAVLLVGDDNGTLFEEAAGHLDFDPNSPQTRLDTIYDVASLTKVVVTTTLAMMLYDEGKLDLDTQVEDYTIRELLTHSAGLKTEPDADISGGHRPPLEYEPGTKSVYSDVGFIILGKIIEQLAGAPLDVLARERIFEPMRMKDTSFNPDPSWLGRIAPTGPSLRGRVHDPNAAAMNGVAGHAGLFSTAPDLALFCRRMLRGGPTIELFTRRDGRVPDSTRALGWDTPSKENSSAGQYFSESSFGHTGFTGTSMWIDPKRRLYAILLTNRIYSNPGNLEIRAIRPKLHDAVILSLPTLKK